MLCSARARVNARRDGACDAENLKPRLAQGAPLRERHDAFGHEPGEYCRNPQRSGQYATREQSVAATMSSETVDALGWSATSCPWMDWSVFLTSLMNETWQSSAFMFVLWPWLPVIRCPSRPSASF